VTATARKIVVLFFNTLRYGIATGIRVLNTTSSNIAARVLANLWRRAKSLGFVLQAILLDANPAVS
jgi:transposase